MLANNDIHEELKSWILKDFFPSIAEEKSFESLSLLKVLNSPNEGVTYALQFKAINEDVINQFRENHLIFLQNKAQLDYPNKVYFFESLMEYQSI
jgi:hypothetical protein